MRLQIILLLFLQASGAIAQQRFTVSGTIKDAASGEELIGATITVTELPGVGVSCNEYGFYSLSLKEGNYNLKVSYIGYADRYLPINLHRSQKLDINMSSGSQLDEVVVLAKKANENVTQAQMGSEKLDIKSISKLPVLFGEKDVLKTLQLLPGVKSAGEGSSGFYVRGGGADQNLILLDEAPVYNASHLLGFFSTFNSDAIKDATLIKGNSPAQYGGRLSSVLDVKMNEGNDKKYNVKGGIGLISSRLSIEGPLQKEKSSFLITGRRTYADVFLKASDKFKDNKLYFYDLNAKANYRINENNRLFVSGYFGRDILGFGKAFGIDWGNKTGTVRWNRLINEKWFSNTSAIYSDYSYNIKIGQGGKTFNINSEIKDANLKQEFQFFPNPQNAWRIGINTIYHTLKPSRFKSENILPDAKQQTRFSWENAAYINNTYNASPKVNIDYGLRFSAFSLLGYGTYRKYEKAELYDYQVLKKNEIGKSYLNLEPRLSLSLQLNAKNSFKTAYARNTQHLHLLSNNTTGSPTDVWIGNTYNIKPEIADQVSLGYFKNFNNNNYELSLESYYKKMRNQIDYKDGADINFAPDIETELLFGEGRAYGLEFYLKKRTGKFTGWVSYTLSKTEKKIEGINKNLWYAAKQDRTHDVSIVGMYQLRSKWSLSAAWVYYTGNAVTFPNGKYQVGGQNVLLYSERNGYRMPAYHRLDLGLTYESSISKKYQSSWNFGIYNAYGRENAYQIDFRENPTDKSRSQAVQTSLFKWVPSITYNFKF